MAGTGEAPPTNAGTGLRARIISAIVLAAAALAANVAGRLVFAAGVAALAALVAWEWGRMVRQQGFDVQTVVHGGSVVLAVGLFASGLQWLALTAVAAAAVAIAAMPGSNRAFSALGPLYVGLPALAMLTLRSGEDCGASMILFIFMVVWATDTFAFFCGRWLGGPKLWPRVSPNKTWSGSAGGLVAGMLVGLGFALFWRASASGLAWLAAVTGLVSVATQVGDLAESALKRRFATKDASRLIPGHGGVFDRLDGLMMAAVVVAALALFVDGAPACRSVLGVFAIALPAS